MYGRHPPGFHRLARSAPRMSKCFQGCVIQFTGISSFCMPDQRSWLIRHVENSDSTYGLINTPIFIRAWVTANVWNIVDSPF